MSHRNLEEHSKRLYKMTIAKNVVDIKKYLVSLKFYDFRKVIIFMEDYI